MNHLVLTENDVQTIINALNGMAQSCDSAASVIHAKAEGDAASVSRQAAPFLESARQYDSLAERVTEAESITFNWRGGRRAE